MKQKQSQHLEALSPLDPIPRSIPSPCLLHLTPGLLVLCLEGVKHIQQNTCVCAYVYMRGGMCVHTCGCTHTQWPDSRE